MNLFVLTLGVWSIVHHENPEPVFMVSGRSLYTVIVIVIVSISTHHNITHLSILVSNQFLDRQHNNSIHRYLSCLHEKNIELFKKYSYMIGQKRIRR